MLGEAIAEDWTAVGRGRAISGTEVRGQVGYASGLGHFTTIAAALDDEHARSAFQAAIGTVAPTPWISPSTYELALGHFAPLRRDPEFVDPDVVVVTSAGHRQFIEIKWRIWTDEIGRQAAEAIEAEGFVSAFSYRPKRQWTHFAEMTDDIVASAIIGGPDVLVEQAAPETEVPALPAPTELLPESAVIAREIRDLSGLSARQLGAVFPVARENFQRWTTGTPPSEANLERLLGLRHFFRAVADRVDAPKNWMLSPISAVADSPTPYSLLVHGDLTTPWDALAELSSRASAKVVYDSEGNRGLRIGGSTRGRSISTPEEEMDDYSEWLDDE